MNMTFGQKKLAIVVAMLTAWFGVGIGDGINEALVSDPYSLPLYMTPFYAAAGGIVGLMVFFKLTGQRDEALSYKDKSMLIASPSMSSFGFSLVYAAIVGPNWQGGIFDWADYYIIFLMVGLIPSIILFWEVFQKQVNPPT